MIYITLIFMVLTAVLSFYLRHSRILITQKNTFISYLKSLLRELQKDLDTSKQYSLNKSIRIDEMEKELENWGFKWNPETKKFNRIKKVENDI